MKSRGLLLAPVLACVVAQAGLAAEVSRSVNEENGLRGWHFTDGEIEIELIQRLPDQTRAMLMNHAFSREVIERMALSCMFQTIIRNTAAAGDDTTVTVDLTRWRMQHDGRVQGILLKEPLLDSWTEKDADHAAKLVIRWGMFPTRQEYRPSDYNWGLTAFGIPPGSAFDLDVSWEVNGRKHSGRIPGLVCAPDVDRLK